MEKDIDNKYPYLVYGREKPPVPWDDRKGAGMTVGELLNEKVEDLIEDN